MNQDRAKGVLTSTGHVPADTDKERAETIAKSKASGQVVKQVVNELDAKRQKATSSSKGGV